MPNHLTIPSVHFAPAGGSAPPSRESSPARSERSGSAGDVPPNLSKEYAKKIKNIKQTLNKAVKACAEGIEKIRAYETNVMKRIDKINCFKEGFAQALAPIAELVECKKNSIKIYDTVINKLRNISARLDSDGITLGPEQTKKLDADALEGYVQRREQAGVPLAVFEAFHHVVKAMSYRAVNDVAAAHIEYCAAVDRLLALPRERWSFQLRPSKVPPDSAWALNRTGVKVLDVKLLLAIAISSEASQRLRCEGEIESGFAHFHNFFAAVLDGLRQVTPPSHEDVSEAGALRYIGYVKDMAASLVEDNNLQTTRKGIAYLKQSIARLDVTGDVVGRDDVRDKASKIKRNYVSEALTMISTVLWAQHIQLLDAQLSFSLSPEAVAVLNQVQDKLADLVVKHPHRLGEDRHFVDVSKFTQEEKEQMYSKLSLLPSLDNEAARQLRYLAADLASETVTQDSKDLPLLMARFSDLAGDLEEAASLAEVVLGELILAGVNPQGDAAREEVSEEWHLQRAYGDDDDKAFATPHSAGSASPREPGSKRNSLIRSRANSLIDRRFGLQSVEPQPQGEIERAKAYSQPIEENMALMIRQAASNKREAEKVLANLRAGIVDSKNPSNTIYELLSLAVDRNQDRLKGLQKMIARWEKIDNPTDEATGRIAGLHQMKSECEEEIRRLKEEAVLKTVEGIELYPTEQGVLFLHKHGLIERMERPLLVKINVHVYDHATNQFVQSYTDGTPRVDYIHEWPIRVRRAPGSDQTFMIYAHDHKKQDTEHPHPEMLKESRMVTWKNYFYRRKGKTWEKQMTAQGWSPQAATVQRSISGQRVLDELVRHYIKDENDRVPVDNRPRRLGRQEPGSR